MLAFALFAVPTSAQAGTLYQSTSCTVKDSNLTDIYNKCVVLAVIVPVEFKDVYCRLGTVSQYGWYPSHRVDLEAAYGGGSNVYTGSWTSSRFAYSPIVNSTWGNCFARTNSSSSTTRTWNNQLYIGRY